jgi:FtsH-binding integral membrane protein
MKIALVVFGVIEIMLGLSLVIFPDQTANMVGFSKPSGYLIYTMVSLGMCLIAPSVYLIVVSRDPLRHINWVKFAILWCILGVVGGVYSIVMGAADFNQVGMQIIMGAIFAVVFLALYPYRAAKGG